MKIYNSPAFNRDITNKSSYKVAFGNKERPNKAIQEVMQDDTLSVAEHDFFQRLVSIEDFNDASIAMKTDALRGFVKYGTLVTPLLEKIFAGDYVLKMNDSDVEKPIVDLKAIAKYNRNHPDEPKNLAIELGHNPLFDAMMRLSGYLNTPNLAPIAFDYTLGPMAMRVSVTERTKQPQNPTVSTTKTARQTDSTLTPPAITDILKSKSNNEIKRAAYELSNSSVFNSVMQDASVDTIKNIIKLKKDYPKITENLLSGKLHITTPKSKNGSKPIFDIKRIIKEKTPSNQILAKNSFASEICRFLGSELCEIDFSYVVVNMDDEGYVDVTIIDKDNNKAKFMPITVSKSIKEYLEENKAFIISLKK